MKDSQIILPLLLDHPRVWRTYCGGAQLDALHGRLAALHEDGHFPEEWLMSVVAARNAGREQFSDEGLSHLMQDHAISLKEFLESNPSAYLGEKHTARYGAHPGVLVKLIDSAERLTIQVHPDREIAQRLFGSRFGKTECWHILGGRAVHGESPCVYLGFRKSTTREQWRTLFLKQDISGMLDRLHRFHVQPGDTIFIESGVPHAIGAGCFLIEMQEPTDYTIRMERTTPSGFAIADEMCHQGLGFDRMFDCFHYEEISREKVREKWFFSPRVLHYDKESIYTQLVGYEKTSLFSLRELEIKGQFSLKNEDFSGLYVLEGAGAMECGGKNSHCVHLLNTFCQQAQATWCCMPIQTPPCEYCNILVRRYKKSS